MNEALLAMLPRILFLHTTILKREYADIGVFGWDG